LPDASELYPPVLTFIDPCDIFPALRPPSDPSRDPRPLAPELKLLIPTALGWLKSPP
jgi:hypothetical protein